MSFSRFSSAAPTSSTGSWRAFLEEAFGRLPLVSAFEIGRLEPDEVGVWDHREYLSLAEPAFGWPPGSAKLAGSRHRLRVPPLRRDPAAAAVRRRDLASLRRPDGSA
jgi:hypothetical protein